MACQTGCLPFNGLLITSYSILKLLHLHYNLFVSWVASALSLSKGIQLFTVSNYYSTTFQLLVTGAVTSD